MAPTAKKIILGLLLAREGALQVREAIAACSLFQITENNVRVTLARLASEQMIQSHGRGAYVLGPAARGAADEITQWQRAPERLCSWRGDYICIQTVGKVLRGKAGKRREWALNMLGARELESGFFVRPNNLRGGARFFHQRLRGLGVAGDMMAFEAQHFDESRQQRLMQLWDTQHLNNHYQNNRAHLLAWLGRSHELDRDTAARESYLLGGQAIRDLVFDPWLPEAMVNAQARAAYFEVVLQFDEAGKRIWQGLDSFQTMMPLAEAASGLTVGTLQ